MNSEGAKESIIDNSPGRELVSVIRDQLGKSKQAKFAIGYFMLSGFSLVKDDFPDEYDDLPFLRLIIGNESSRSTRDEMTSGYNLRSIFKQRMIEDLQEAEIADEQMEQLRTLKDFVAKNVIDIRLFEKSRLHAKLYLFLTTPVEQYSSPGLAVVGSSNLTAKGLTENRELNVLLTSREEVVYLNRWFDEVWDQATEFREDLIKVIDFSGVLPESPYPPVGTLVDPQTLFKYLVNRWFEGRVLNLLGTDILMEFQLVGVVNAVNMVSFYNGVVLADSVGLGKSFMASEVVEDFLRGKHPTWIVRSERAPAVLLILPPSIIPQWEELLIGRMDEDVRSRLSEGEKTRTDSEYFLKDNLKRLIGRRGNQKVYEIYDETGKMLLGSLGFLSLGIFQNMQEVDLRRLAEEFDLFVIDEAHKYRNKSTNRWRNARILQKKSDNSPNKFLLLTATPLSNSINDLFNIIRLFVDDTFAPFRVKGIQITDLMKRYADLRNKLERDDDDDTRKTLHEVATRIKQDVLDEVMVLRTRNYVMDQFKDLKINGRPLVFKDPRPHSLDYSPFYGKDYEHLIDLLRRKLDGLHFEYTKLYGTRFVVFESEEEDEKRRYIEIADLFRLLLGKRLESGLYPFETTLRRILEKERIFFRVLEKKWKDIASPESLREVIEVALKEARIQKDLEEVLEAYEIEEDGEEETWFGRVVALLLDYAQDSKEAGKDFSDEELLKLGLRKLMDNLRSDIGTLEEVVGVLDKLKAKGRVEAESYWANLEQKQRRLPRKEIGDYRVLGMIPKTEEDIVDLPIFTYTNDPKLDALKQLLGDPSLKSVKLEQIPSLTGKRIVIFTQYKDTAYYLYHNLLDWVSREVSVQSWLKDEKSRRMKIGLVTGDTDTSTKINYIKRFAPRANSGHEEAKRLGELEILVSTDALSEGVNLQDADAVIDYDLPWNPMVIVQRVGRVNRIGNEKDVLVVNFIPSTEIEIIVGVLAKLREKITDITLVVGKETRILSPDEEISVETFGERIRDISRLPINELERYGMSEDFKQFIPEGIPQEQLDEYRLLNIIQHDLSYDHDDFEDVASMGDGPYYTFLRSDVERVFSVYEFYRGKYKIIKRILTRDVQSKETSRDTPLVLLDLIRRGESEPRRIENAIENLKELDDTTKKIKEDLKAGYQQEQKGFLYFLYNALLIERVKAQEMRDRFTVVMNALQTIPYYLYSRDIRALLTERGLIEVQKDMVLIKDFKDTVDELNRFLEERGLTEIDSLKVRVNHLGWFYEV